MATDEPRIVEHIHLQDDALPPARGGNTNQPSASTSVEEKLDVLSHSIHRLIESLATSPAEQDDSNFDEDALLAENLTEAADLFDPSLSITAEDKGNNDLFPDSDLFNDPDECGDAVSSDLAKRVDAACSKKPAKDKLTKIQQRYLRPRNCSLLLVPKVNPELWDDLSDAARSR